MTGLPAGRELDALVAERVMGQQWEKVTRTIGWKVTPENPRSEPAVTQDEWELREHGEPVMVHGEMMHGYFPCPVPNYSTNVAAAWKVVENRRALGWDFLLAANGLFPHFGFRVRLAPPGHKNGDATAETAPHAICLAALKAVGHEASHQALP